MNTILFNLIIALIPIVGAVITTYAIPYLKSITAAKDLETAQKWVSYAVNAAEVLFKKSNSGNEKREFVINFINEKVNSNKEVITEEQIRVLLEACWKESIATAEALTKEAE